MLVAFLVVGICVTIILFIKLVAEYPTSDNLDDLSAYGDYFGGVLNPIIGIVSLCILGYLTYFVSRKGAKENKSLFILQQRTIAFNSISNFEVNYHSYFHRAMATTGTINSIMGKGEKVVLNDVLSDIQNNHLKLLESCNQILHFEQIHGHWFKYDFENELYIKLLINLREEQQRSIKFMEAIYDGNSEKTIQYSQNSKFDDIIKGFEIFISEIKPQLSIL